jgi:DNA processing protein
VVSEHTWELRTGHPIADAEHLHTLCTRGMPRVLFGAGERADAFDRPRIAIVGTRTATPAGLADARDIGAFCARAGCTVVSGLALGIDGAAHEGALDGGGLTVGVVATGLDVVYPPQHVRLFARVREQGLIVTENAAGTSPLPWRFPIRNRLIAALADVVVVVEATTSGGALSTASYARDFGREVYAVPGSRRNPAAAGCNALIRDGAHSLIEPSDLLFAIGRGGTIDGGWSPPPKPPADRDQRAVLRACAGHGVTSRDIEVACGLPPERLGRALRALEQSGALTRRRGMWWPV